MSPNVILTLYGTCAFGFSFKGCGRGFLILNLLNIFISKWIHKILYGMKIFFLIDIFKVLINTNIGFDSAK